MPKNPIREAAAAFLRVVQPERQYMRPSFAEFGEDLLMNAHVERRGTPNKTFLDIGSNHPVASNNTYFFSRLGWRGVCVDPNSDFIPLYKKYRPHDTFLTQGIAIGSEEEADYYMFSVHGLNTFSVETAKLRESGGHPIQCVEKRPLVPLNDLLAKHFSGSPAIMSIDAEGLDSEILNTLDFQMWQPTIVCAEIVGDRASSELLTQHGYKLIGQLFSNQVWVLSKDTV